MNTESLERNAYQLLSKTGYVVYDSEAEKDAIYPYIVYNFRKINTATSSRDDFVLTIDVWNEDVNYSIVNTIADNIQNAMNNLNNPDDEVLPTYYIENRSKIADENKKIKRVQLEFSVQNYFL